MRGPDDVDPVQPFEIYLTDGTRRARWICPRCRLPNASDLAAGGLTPAVCRVCFGAAQISVPGIPDVSLRGAWITTLPGGAVLHVEPKSQGGYSYEADVEGRCFGAYDTSWSRQDAYDAGLRAVQARRKRRV